MSAGFDLSAMADTVWMLALMAMSIRSLRTWKSLPEDGPAPMLWAPDGRTAIAAGRDLAVLFTPIAAMIGGLLLALGEKMSGDAVSDGLVFVRFAAPVLLVFAHRHHLQAAVAETRAEQP